MKANKLTAIAILLAALFFATPKAKAQVNAQVLYDFGSDREFVTLTLEMFKQDKWGNTYFFVDHDFNYDQHVKGPNLAPGGSYFEIARCLNFWQNSAIKNLSLQVEYNGGIQSRTLSTTLGSWVWTISSTAKTSRTPLTSRRSTRTFRRRTLMCLCS